jgi:hypothetical protein
MDFDGTMRKNSLEEEEVHPLLFERMLANSR